LNQWSGEQSGGSKYGIERWEINAETEEADAGPEEATQRQQRLHRVSKACVIHVEATGVTQKAKEVG